MLVGLHGFCICDVFQGQILGIRYLLIRDFGFFFSRFQPQAVGTEKSCNETENMYCLFTFILSTISHLKLRNEQPL